MRRSDLPAKNDNTVQQTHRSAWFAGKPGSYKGMRTAPDQVGCQAASPWLWLWLLNWLLIFLPPREAEWRFCAVGKPAWMPV